MEPQSTHTLSEALFVLTAFMVAPAFGLAGLMLGARRISPLVRVLIPALAVVAGLSGIGAVVLTTFPQYPYIAPPDKTTALLVSVGHFFGAVALWLVSRARLRREEAPPRALAIVSGLVWLGATGASIVLAMVVVMPPRLALPAEATRIEEEMMGDKLLPDYSYTLSADMSPTAYEDYVQRIGMPSSKGRERVLERGDCGTRVTYEGGRMRLTSWCE